jgi:hypothetical protein
MISWDTVVSREDETLVADTSFLWRLVAVVLSSWIHAGVGTSRHGLNEVAVGTASSLHHCKGETLYFISINQSINFIFKTAKGFTAMR